MGQAHMRPQGTSETVRFPGRMNSIPYYTKLRKNSNSKSAWPLATLTYWQFIEEEEGFQIFQLLG